MYLGMFSDEELVQYAARVSKWLSEAEKTEIATEIERRTPGGRERLRKEKREAKREALEENWRQNMCAKDASGNWTVPHELVWRSLPHGEDR